MSTALDHPVVAPSLPRSRIAAIARQWGASIDVEAYRNHPTDRRWFYRLCSEADYVVWLLGWDYEQSTDFHDHGGSSGALMVVDGTLVESRMNADGQTLNHQISKDGLSVFGPDAIHNVYNAGLGPSLSVHVYSPPLGAMTYFKSTDEGAAQLETVAVDSPEPDGREMTH